MSIWLNVIAYATAFLFAVNATAIKRQAGELLLVRRQFLANPYRARSELCGQVQRSACRIEVRVRTHGGTLWENVCHLPAQDTHQIARYYKLSFTCTSLTPGVMASHTEMMIYR